jgi:hypothetical protein
MVRHIFLIIGFIVATGLPNIAHASQLNPCFRVLTFKDGRFGQEKIRALNMCDRIGKLRDARTVHEHMAIAALSEHKGAPAFAAAGPQWKFQYMVDKTWPGHRTYALVFGTWWNDDPLMRSWGQGLDDFVWGGVSLWWTMEKERTHYPGGTSGCSVPADIHLGRQSHFGPLQHLHFMTTQNRDLSTAEQRVASTTDAALTWMRFAYRVAIREIDADAPLTSEMEAHLHLPSIARNHCVQDATNVKVRTLFSRLGQDLAVRREITPDVALGSMLHVLQDSFSPSHTCRVEQLKDNVTKAVLVDVGNYNEQNTDAHASLDGYPRWMQMYAETGQHIYANDPITVGAWLIAAAGQKLPWDEVESHLRQTIFARDESGRQVSNDTCIGRTVELLKKP